MHKITNCLKLSRSSKQNFKFMFSNNLNKIQFFITIVINLYKIMNFQQTSSHNDFDHAWQRGLLQSVSHHLPPITIIHPTWKRRKKDSLNRDTTNSPNKFNTPRFLFVLPFETKQIIGFYAIYRIKLDRNATWYLFILQ